MEDHVPKRFTNNSRKQPWITKKAKQLCRMKQRWFKKMKNCNSERVKTRYLEIKKECQSECRRAKASYLNQICDNHDNNNRLFWKYIKSRKKDNAACTFLRDEKGNLQSNPEVKAKLLNDQFSSVFSPAVNKDIVMDEAPFPAAEEITVDVNGVLKL